MSDQARRMMYGRNSNRGILWGAAAAGCCTGLILMTSQAAMADTVESLAYEARHGSSIKVKADACDRLVEMNDPKAADVFLDLLSSPVNDWCAARGLGKLRERRAVPPLIELLARDSESDRTAIWALGEIGDTSALAPLRSRKERTPFLSKEFQLTIDEAIQKLEAAH